MATEETQPPSAAAIEGDVPSSIDLFLEKHKKSLILALVAIVVLVFGAIIVINLDKTKQTAAAEAFSGASSIEEFSAVTSEHPGSVPAGNALLMKADLQSQAGDLNEAQATLTTFVNGYADHPRYWQGVLALGINAENKGAMDEAMRYYQQVVDSDANDVAPLAQIRKGDVEYARGNYDAARNLYQNIAPTYPGTPFSYLVQQKLARPKLQQVPPAPAPPTSGGPAITPAPPAADSAAGTPAPSPAPQTAPPAPQTEVTTKPVAIPPAAPAADPAPAAPAAEDAAPGKDKDAAKTETTPPASE